MDWSVPTNVISLTPVVDTDPLLAGRVAIAQNGGADLLYWTGPASLRAAGLTRLRARVAARPGVLSVVTTRSQLLGARAGDLVAYARPGWRFADPHVMSNPIPGNHGHPVTAPIPLFVTGGAPVVPRGQVRERTTYPMDVAPTVARLFGLPAPAGGFDGRTLL